MILNLMYITTTKIICFIGLMLNYSSERQIYTIKVTFSLIFQGIRIAFSLKNLAMIFTPLITLTHVTKSEAL